MNVSITVKIICINISGDDAGANSTFYTLSLNTLQKHLTQRLEHKKIMHLHTCIRGLAPSLSFIVISIHYSVHYMT